MTDLNEDNAQHYDFMIAIIREPLRGASLQTAYLLPTSPTGCRSLAHVKTESLRMLKNWHQSFRLPEASGNCSTRIFRITCGARSRGPGKRTELLPSILCPLALPLLPWVSLLEQAERKRIQVSTQAHFFTTPHCTPPVSLNIFLDPKNIHPS